MDWNGRIDVLEKVARIIAVIVAGAWVYFNALRGRTFVPRLQLELSGRLFSERGKQYLLVTMQVKNAGSSIVKITQGGTCLKMNPLCGDASSEVESLKREGTKLFPCTKLFPVLYRYMVFTARSVGTPISEIEPGSAINEEHLFLQPAHQTHDFEIELRVQTIRWWIPAKLVFKPREEKESGIHAELIFKEDQKRWSWIPDRWIQGRKFSAVAVPVEADATKVDKNAD